MDDSTGTWTAFCTCGWSRSGPYIVGPFGGLDAQIQKMAGDAGMQHLIISLVGMAERKS